MPSLFVIKIGGNVLDDATALHSFLADVATINAPKILVHGGGKIATQIGNQLGITSQYVGGRRITDAATIQLVTMVYGGLINKQLVAQLQSFGCNAVGLTGADGNIMPAQKRSVTNVDYGFVGDVLVHDVNTSLLLSLIQQGITPVFAPLTHDGAAQILNTNADTIASVLAAALSTHYKVRLMYCFEKNGVLQNIHDDESVVPLITPTIYHQMKTAGLLFDGMLPKIDNAFAAIQQGVHEVLIGHASNIIQNTTHNIKGTLITTS
ncbi:acetylglutamate kinase [Ferruginibacter yonginensis]|uniref:Acetylglutamate kinase n=1 Tax=Ferruginibacter yonginensis TaxID=1310416 RepID=A0ABV8QUY8_9BACT